MTYVVIGVFVATVAICAWHDRQDAIEARDDAARLVSRRRR